MIRLKSINRKWLIIGIVSLIYAITRFQYIMYAGLIYQLFLMRKSTNSYEKLKKKEFIDLILISLIMPDNYVILLIIAFCYMFSCNKRTKEKRVLIVFCSLWYLLINIIVNVVPIANVIISAIYMLPFWGLLVLSRYFFENQPDIVEYLCCQLKKIVLIELVVTFVYGMSHLQLIRSYNDMDWVTGTLGEYQCNVLMCICSFSFLLFWNEYMVCEKKEKKWLIMSGVLALSTGAVAYTILFIGSILIVTLFSIQTRISKKILLSVLCVLGIITFIEIVPTWMSDELLKMSNIEYVNNRITKIKYYENTFLGIPKNEGAISFIFGTGLGQYSSRTAETCAGGYVSLYDSFAKTHETTIRKKYISAPQYGGDGLTGSSASSILSLQGELGILGLIFVIIFLFNKGRESRNVNSIICVVYFIGLMFFDNTLEFAKYGTMFWFIYFACNNMKKRGT